MPNTNEDADLKRVQDIFMIALCIYREARGEEVAAKWGVANVIINRTLKPGWWGKDVMSVITTPMQFSSFNKNDPNSTKFPNLGIKAEREAWEESMRAARDVYTTRIGDNTKGAVYYHDKSIDNKPPAQAKDKEWLHIGNLRFYS